MSELTDTLVDGAVTFRISRLIVQDKLTEPARQWLYDRYPPEGWILEGSSKPRGPMKYWETVDWGAGPDKPGYLTKNGSFIGNLTNCIWCTSIWVAAGVVTTRTPSLIFRPRKWLRAVLAAATMSVVISHQAGD